MQVYFARHGQTASAATGRLKTDDESLTKEGVAESDRAAKSLQSQLDGATVSRIIASPRTRTKETAAIFGRTLGFVGSIETDPRLAERDCTAYAGQLISDVFSQSEEALVAGGMEPYGSVYARTKELYDEVVTTTDQGGVVLLVGHSTAVEPLTLISRGLLANAAVPVAKLAVDSVLRLSDPDLL